MMCSSGMAALAGASAVSRSQPGLLLRCDSASLGIQGWEFLRHDVGRLGRDRLILSTRIVGCAGKDLADECSPTHHIGMAERRSS